MPLPEFYNSSTIDVDPNVIWTESQSKVIVLGKQIAENVEGIHKVWNDLEVGWVGDTQEEADAFNQEWNSALTLIFGKENDPDSGVLSQVAKGIMIAASNYANTEDTVTKMFNQFTAALNAPPDPNATPDPNRNVDQGPITEITPK